MTEQHVAHRWIIKVSGSEEFSVEPGNSVEIGRKPIRPLNSDGFTRFEIKDTTRSMSKRHALLTVAKDGTAAIRDLNSTNGSFIVRPNGELQRIREGADFTLPASPVRLQFGDVAVDFIKIERSADEESRAQASNLFQLAGAHDGDREPDDLSVDEILDVRAGEPTSVVDAGRVAERLKDQRAQQPGTEHGEHDDVGGLEEVEPVAQAEPEGITLHVVPPDQEAEVKQRDLFADAAEQVIDQATQAPVEEATGQTVQESDIPQTSEVAADANHQEGVGTGEVSADAEEANNAPTSGSPQSTTDSDASSNEDVTITSVEVTGVITAPLVQEDDNSDGGLQQDGSSKGTTSPQATVEPQGDTDSQYDTVSDADQAGDADQPVDTDVANRDVGLPDAESNESSSSTFAPGSVFELVSKGELKSAQEAIEVDGLSSEDAMHTTDFALQFEMAKHPQLLPFLAMNPGLYDDLYAWLHAQGNDDVDAALAHNEGYDDYRESIGK